VAFAEFSPNGQRIATFSADSTLRLWDVDTGYALAEPVKEVSGCAGVRFNHDGGRLVMSCVATRVWDLPPVGGSCPGWLLSLAEAISGERVNSRNLLEKTETNRATIVNSVREQLQECEPDDWATWGRWFLANPRTRTISPHSSMTLHEYVENRIETGTIEAFEECERLPFLDSERLHRIEQARANLEQRQPLMALQNRLGHSIRQTTTTRSATPELIGGQSTGRQVIYEDALENGWEDWSWAKVDFANTIPVYGGFQVD